MTSAPGHNITISSTRRSEGAFVWGPGPETCGPARGTLANVVTPSLSQMCSQPQKGLLLLQNASGCVLSAQGTQTVHQQATRFFASSHEHLHIQMSVHTQRVLRRVPHLHRQLPASRQHQQMPCQHQKLRLCQRKHTRHSASALRKQVRSTCASSCPLSLSMETHSAWVTTHTSG